MPFDGQSSGAKTVVMIDALLDYFAGGENRLQGRWMWGRRRCLTGAMRYM